MYVYIYTAMWIRRGVVPVVVPGCWMLLATTVRRCVGTQIFLERSSIERHIFHFHTHVCMPNGTSYVRTTIDLLVVSAPLGPRLLSEMTLINIIETVLTQRKQGGVFWTSFRRHTRQRPKALIRCYGSALKCTSSCSVHIVVLFLVGYKKMNEMIE